MKFGKKLLAALLAVITVLGMMSIAAFAADKVITGNVNVTITTPVAGEKPSIDCVVNSNNVTVTAFSWYDKETGAMLDPAGTDVVYQDGSTYTAKIVLTPNENCEFAEDISITVNDDAPSTVRYTDNSIIVEVNFNCDKGTGGNSFFAGLKQVLLNLLKIVRDIISNFIGF